MLDAVGHYRQTTRRFDLARVAEDAAAALEGCGRRVEAVALLEDALRCWEAFGADHDARRAGAALRALGVSRGARGPRHRPVAGIESLTPTERTVLELVGAGLRNAEIAERLYVSRRTVETHVGRLCAKLHVQGRVAPAKLAAAPARRTPPTGRRRSALIVSREAPRDIRARTHFAVLLARSAGDGVAARGSDLVHDLAACDQRGNPPSSASRRRKAASVSVSSGCGAVSWTVGK